MFVGVDAHIDPHETPAKSHNLGDLPQPPNLRRGGVLPLPAVQRRELGRTNAKRDMLRARRSLRDFIGASCAGGVEPLPYGVSGDVTFFTIRYGKFVVAQRADRGVRPYKTVCVFADGLCNFAIAYRRVDVGIDPYRHFSYSPSVVQICPCVLHGRGDPLPYVTTK